MRVCVCHTNLNLNATKGLERGYIYLCPTWICTHFFNAHRCLGGTVTKLLTSVE